MNDPLPNDPHPAGWTPPPADPGASTLDNPFRRIFKPDGTVNQEYVLSRLQHLEGLLKTNQDFFPIRFDRDQFERILSNSQDLFATAKDDESFEAAFRLFAERALPDLVTQDFDELAKETLKAALHDRALTRKDRAASACGIVLTLPEEGEPQQPHHQNPFFDQVLRITFNESMSRVEFMQKLASEEISEVEREAKIQEFLRSVPALLYELNQGFERVIKKALKSYERGDYSFGIGVDMTLHGVRALRKLTMEYGEDAPDAQDEERNKRYAERFGQAIKETFVSDIGEEEEAEILDRMGHFLEEAHNAGAKKAANGLSAALTVMHQNPEIRQRMLFAAYHEAVTGSRIFRLESEEEAARAIYADPLDLANYLGYGDLLVKEGHLARAERVLRAALEFFPDSEEVREKLAAAGAALEPDRVAEVKARIEEIERQEEAGEDVSDDEEE